MYPTIPAAAVLASHHSLQERSMPTDPPRYVPREPPIKPERGLEIGKPTEHNTSDWDAMNPTMSCWLRRPCATYRARKEALRRQQQRAADQKIRELRSSLTQVLGLHRHRRGSSEGQPLQDASSGSAVDTADRQGQASLLQPRAAQGLQTLFRERGADLDSAPLVASHVGSASTAEEGAQPEMLELEMSPDLLSGDDTASGIHKESGNGIIGPLDTSEPPSTPPSRAAIELPRSML